MKISFIIPAYNDEASLKKLIDKIKIELKEFSLCFVIIDDCSKDDFVSLKDFSQLNIISLKKNQGSQKAISIGLHYILDKKIEFDYLIVMDSDGEDKPEDINSLIQESLKEDNYIIFASRKKRLENLIFKFFYLVYRIVFKIMTGKKINFGNFSCIPKHLLRNIANTPFIDFHYSAAIIKSKYKYKCIPCDKGNRYLGKSKMSFFNLSLHALKSVSVFSREIFIRFLIIFFIGNLFLLNFEPDLIFSINLLLLIPASVFFLCSYSLINKAFNKENLMNESNYTNSIKNIKSL